MMQGAKKDAKELDPTKKPVRVDVESKEELQEECLDVPVVHQAVS
jgi:hypothetical protein